MIYIAIIITAINSQNINMEALPFKKEIDCLKYVNELVKDTNTDAKCIKREFVK